VRVVVQRVERASVSVAGREEAAIGRGMVVLVGFGKGDGEGAVKWMAKKVASLRIFSDQEGKMNLPAEAVGGEILVVSQFTLYGDCRKGKRPSFDESADPARAERLYWSFLTELEEATPCPVRSGLFREHMHVSLVNDGPVTLIIEREEREGGRGG